MKRTLVTIYLWTFILFDFTSILILTSLANITTRWFDPFQRVGTFFMLFLGGKVAKAWPGWKIDVVGREKYNKNIPTIYISNHQSFLDMPLQSMYLRNIKWVAKAELFSVPIMGWFMKLTRQISVNRGKSSAADLFKKSLPAIKKGYSICIFPEGGRTRNRELLPFKKGAFMLAWEAQVPVQPLVLDGGFDLNQPDDWRFVDKGELHLHFLDPIHPKDFSSVDELTKYCHKIFEERLALIRGEKTSE